jgi:hypothetical protein
MSTMRSVLEVPLFFVLLIPFAACGSTALRSAGTLCSSDPECGAGLSCLGLGTFTDAGCTTLAKSCSKPCAQNSDCTSLGSRFMCLVACDGTRACGATF